MRIRFEIKNPAMDVYSPEFSSDPRDARERADIDLSTIVMGLVNLVPPGKRQNIKVKDGDGNVHIFESAEQVKEIYRRDGWIGLYYAGKESPSEGGQQ